ncbi:unnamed protein product [Meganyctiphanes norvegica]|uniref:Arrestin C-terminal-like domain-containing protein n=1 Tax=Meganyctiphanes norvegica TaxID=48144 RepID=A0AAV2PYQ9_MEGNR
MAGNIRIALDNRQALYFPDQTVSGKVIVDNHELLVTRGISIKFSGESQTKLQTSRQSSTEEFDCGREEYYVERNFLLGNGNDNEPLKPGEHVYRFSFRLPLNIPSSYETVTGQVRHQCKAKVHLPCGSHIAVVRPFSVNSLYDLNLDEDAKLPVEKKIKKTFTFSFGSISLTLLLARIGFVPGEKLNIHLEVNNDSRKSIKCIKLKLIKDAIYHASSGATKSYTMTLGKMMKEDITAPGVQVIWTETGPVIPAVPPSYLQYCNIIDMRYRIQIILSPKGFSRSIKLEQPIIIGSIPLREHFSLYSMIQGIRETTTHDDHTFTPEETVPVLSASARPVTSSSNSNSDNPPVYNHSWSIDVGEAPIFPAFNDYPEMPPPSYTESQHSTHINNAANSNGTPQNPFNPSYVVFNPSDSRPSAPCV